MHFNHKQETKFHNQLQPSANLYILILGVLEIRRY